jgi:hypothetical protein
MKLTLIKIGAGWCFPCKNLERRGTLSKFAKEHPDVTVQQHDDTEAGGSSRWETFADKWRVKNIPVLIWVAGGEELFRSEDVTAAGIEKQYRRALKETE